jgi:hypothetical protein
MVVWADGQSPVGNPCVGLQLSSVLTNSEAQLRRNTSPSQQPPQSEGAAQTSGSVRAVPGSDTDERRDSGSQSADLIGFAAVLPAPP